MSARSSTVGPGLPPFTVASTPVFPTPVRTSSPSARRRSATTWAVRTSSKASSGCACRSRRVSVISRSSASPNVRRLGRVVVVIEVGHRKDRAGPLP